MHKIIKVFLISMIISPSIACLPPRCFGYWETVVDVLVAEDEEFRDWAGFLFGYYRWLWYLEINDAFNAFESTFGITFRIRGTVEWNSAEDHAYYMLQEAIEDTGFVSGVTVVNGYVIDLLMVFTGVWTMIGLSPPDWEALIVSTVGWGGIVYEDVFKHELSHQFYCPHCDDLNCVMFEEPACYGRGWCSECQAVINTNKDRFQRWVYGGGGGCPTLFVYDGNDYVEEGLLNIHADSDVTVQHEIQNLLALENDVYKLQLRELDNYTSHIDQVKLYAVDYEGEWHLCPLTYAYHNTLGKVKHTLRFDDSNRLDLEPTQLIDLKFAQPISYDKTAYFTFEINGYNQKTPFL